MTDSGLAEKQVNTRLSHWEAMTEIPLALVAVIFLVLYSAEVLAHLQGTADRVCEGILFGLYILFVGDYIIRLVLAQNRFQWIFNNLLDLAAVALPFLRPLRVLRLVAVVGALQRALGGAIRGSVILYSALTSLLLVYAASLAVLEAERGAPRAYIKNFGDAVWWSITTITTVGYGEFYPVTVTGRLIAVMLMIGGISLIGTITATVAAWIVDRVAQEDTEHQIATVAHIAQLRAEIGGLTELVAAQKKIIDRSDPDRGTAPDRNNAAVRD